MPWNPGGYRSAIGRGEQGLPGRRFFVVDAVDSGQRLAHLHCWTVGDSAIERCLAFRDYLRERPELAQEYGALKLRCATARRHDRVGYGDCKEGWIKRVEADAVQRRASTST